MSLTIVRALGLISVQDLGRPGHMHEGLAPGGALVPELLVTANRWVHNPDGTAAIEVCGQLVVRAERDLLVASEKPRVLHAGEELTITSGARRVAYLAVRGGIDAPLVLGGRGTQLSAGLGGLLRANDHVLTADAPEATAVPSPFVDGDVIRLVPGPDAAAFPATALAALYSAPYKISPMSNRVGTRLDGPAIARRADWKEASRPMVRGAIEVPADGVPIVLGPEHPTTGGYPVVAVVAHGDLGKLFAVRLGGVVRFRQAQR